MAKPRVRKGMPSVQLSRQEFSRRVRERFYDPTFTAMTREIDAVIDPAESRRWLLSILESVRLPEPGGRFIDPW